MLPRDDASITELRLVKRGFPHATRGAATLTAV